MRFMLLGFAFGIGFLFVDSATAQPVPIGGTGGNDDIRLWKTDAGVHMSEVNGGGPMAHPGAVGFVIMGLAGNDTINGRAFEFPDGPVTVPMEVHGGPGNDTIDGGTAGDNLFGDGDMDFINGHEGTDTIDGGSEADKLFGGSENDRITGGLGRDLVVGGIDDDTLQGNEGDDEIWGDTFGIAVGGFNDGIDFIEGNDDNDKIFGCGRRDTIFGDAGKDRIWGNDGNDMIMGGTESDVIFGGFGIDMIHGDDGSDSIFGDPADDFLFGDDSDDRIFGGPHADLIHGDAGNDKVFGQGNVDSCLEGNAGDDLVVGGAAVDPVVDGGGHVMGDTCAECPPDGCINCEILLPAAGEIGCADPVTATFDAGSRRLSLHADFIDWLADNASAQHVDSFVAVDPVTQFLIPGRDVLLAGGAIPAIQGLACPDPVLGADLVLSPVNFLGTDPQGHFLFDDGFLNIVSPNFGSLVMGTLTNMTVSPQASMFSAQLVGVVVNPAVSSGMLTEVRSAVVAGAPINVWLLDTDGVRNLLAATNNFTTSGSAIGDAEVLVPCNLLTLGDGCPFPGAIASCGAGTVDLASGHPADVLLVNGTAGDARREVTVPMGSPVEVRLLSAPGGPFTSAAYVVWFWLGVPENVLDVDARGSTLGCVPNATPLHASSTPQPFVCVRGNSMPQAVSNGVRVLTSPPSVPFQVARQRGFTRVITISQAGVIRDNRSANPTGFSMTNVVVLNVR